MNSKHSVIWDSDFFTEKHDGMDTMHRKGTVYPVDMPIPFRVCVETTREQLYDFASPDQLARAVDAAVDHAVELTKTTIESALPMTDSGEVRVSLSMKPESGNEDKPIYSNFTVEWDVTVTRAGDTHDDMSMSGIMYLTQLKNGQSICVPVDIRLEASGPYLETLGGDKDNERALIVAVNNLFRKLQRGDTVIPKDGSPLVFNLDPNYEQMQVSEPETFGMPILEVDYTNWRGERRRRKLLPVGTVTFGSDNWHPSPQYFMSCLDLESGETRNFALAGFHMETANVAR